MKVLIAYRRAGYERARARWDLPGTVGAAGVRLAKKTALLSVISFENSVRSHKLCARAPPALIPVAAVAVVLLSTICTR